MDGILVINKEKGYTSRDVVNIVGKHLGTKKVGHTGTLDPLATGVLVICVGKALKISELLTSQNKEYLARGTLGFETDTLDITGNIVKKNNKINITKKKLEETLKSFSGKINQEVPIYSAIKVNGKKLYEYARNKEEVELPIKQIEIFSLELLDFKDNEFTIKCLVSKGTYIRSLIRDIGLKLNTYATMTDLTRTKQGNFSLDNSYTISDLKDNNYQLLSILEVLPNIRQVIVTNDLLKKVKNGMVLDKFFDDREAFVLDEDKNLISLYKKIDNNKVKQWKKF